MRKQRIRCVGILVENNQVLMVLHKHLTQEEYWLMPPGGGLIGDETVYEAAVREVFEETNIRTRPCRIIYIRQFLEDERLYHNLEVYVLLERIGGHLEAGTDPEEDIQYIQEVGFYSQEDLGKSPLTVHPNMMRHQFWQDAGRDFPGQHLYLGLSSVEEERNLAKAIEEKNSWDREA